MARYELAQESYIDDKPFAQGAIFDDVDGKHKPGPHWKPLDDHAKEICAKHGVKFTGEIPDMVHDMTLKLEAEMKAKAERDAIAGSPAAIGAAVVTALADAGMLKKPAARPAEI